MHRLLPVASLLLCLESIPAIAADTPEATAPPRSRRSLTIYWNVQTNPLSLAVLPGIGGRYMLTERVNLRGQLALSLDLTRYWTGGSSTTTAGTPPLSSDLVSIDAQLGPELLLKNVTPLIPYIAGTLAWSNLQQLQLSENSVSLEDKSWSIGVRGIVGVVWLPVKWISLGVEYSLGPSLEAGVERTDGTEATFNSKRHVTFTTGRPQFFVGLWF